MGQLGKKIIELRVKNGLSQDELAEKLNNTYGTSINKGMVSKWENNLSEPKLDHARIISLFFNVSLDELLGLNNDVEINTIAAHFEGENFTEEEIKEILDYAKYIKSKRKEG